MMFRRKKNRTFSGQSQMRNRKNYCGGTIAEGRGWKALKEGRITHNARKSADVLQSFGREGGSRSKAKFIA